MLQMRSISIKDRHIFPMIPVKGIGMRFYMLMEYGTHGKMPMILFLNFKSEAISFQSLQKLLVASLLA